jgi:hypothetical protein
VTSIRDNPVLWLGAQKKVAGSVTVAGGSVLTKTPPHALDGPEHLDATHTDRLLSTVDHSGLLLPLSGDAGDRLAGDGSWQAEASALTVKDEGVALSTAADSLDFVGGGVTATGTGAAKTITIPGGATADDAYIWKPVMTTAPNIVSTDGADVWVVLTDGSGNPIMAFDPA